MDLDSKIKSLKEECGKLDEERSIREKRIFELKALVEEKKKKSARLEEMKRVEEELLASL
jgi:hypothetical protein